MDKEERKCQEVLCHTLSAGRSRVLIKFLQLRWFFHFNAWETLASSSEREMGIWGLPRQEHSPICQSSRGSSFKQQYILFFLNIDLTHCFTALLSWSLVLVAPPAVWFGFMYWFSLTIFQIILPLTTRESVVGKEFTFLFKLIQASSCHGLTSEHLRDLLFKTEL